MAVVTVRNLPEETHRALRVRAAQHGRSTEARAARQAISTADGQIAAIAAAHGFTVATRDTAPFVAAGVPVINPWELGG